MRLKSIILCNLLFFLVGSRVFAHGVEASEGTTQPVGVWMYVIASLFILAIIGYIYAFYLKNQLKNKHVDKTQKEIRSIKQDVDRKRKQVIKLSTGLVIIALVISVAWVFSQKENIGIEMLNKDVSIEVETFVSEGRDHINLGDPTPAYKTNPPTSGPHSPNTVDYGYYEKRLPFELLVHNIEHGDIVIYYHPELSDEVKGHLKYLSSFTKVGSGVVVLPNEQIEGGVVATAWTKKMHLSTFDEDKLSQFIHDFIYEGPEKLPPKH
jgi:hypothetical protein